MIFVLIGVIGYALLPIWVKHIQPSGLSPLDIATWRFTFAMPIMWVLLVSLRTPLPDKPLPRRGLLVLGILLAGAALCAFVGLEHLPAGTFVLLFYSYPAMVAFINLFFGERLGAQSWLALALTLVGIAFTVPDFGIGLTDGDWIGIGFAFLNALLVALYFVYNNRLLRGHSAMRRASAWAISGACFVFWVLIPIRTVDVPQVLQTWLLLIGLAVVSTVMPIFMFMLGIQRLGSSRAAILSTVEPIGTLIFAALLLGETLESIQLLGGALIITSVLLLHLPLRKQMPATAVGD